MKSISEAEVRLASEAIASCTEFPNTQNVGIVASINDERLKRIIKSSKILQKQLMDKTREYIYGLDEARFIDCVRSTGWIRNMPEKAQRIVYQRADEILTRAVGTVDGEYISNNLLSGKTRFSGHFIKKRIESNCKLRKTVNDANVTLIESLSDRELIKKMATDGWYTNIGGKAKKIVDRRVNQIVLDAIRNFDGVVGYKTVARKVGWGGKGVSDRIRGNAKLRAAFARQPIVYIKELTDEEFIRKLKRKGWTSQFTPEAKMAVEKRVRKMLTRGIDNAAGIVTFAKITRAIGCTGGLRYYITRYPDLIKRADDKSIKYINSLTDREFLEVYSREVNEFINLRKTVRQRIYDRLDNIIIRAIQAQRQGWISAPILGAYLGGFSQDIILHRLENNPLLWTVFYQKKGLSLDQALELELQRRTQPSQSVSQVLNRRLESLYAFREMIGVSRCFGNLVFNTTVLEVSLYPDPLGKAVALLGQTAIVRYHPLQPFRKVGTKATIQENAEIAVLQSIHRVATGGLTRLFEEVYRNLGVGKTVIATYGLYSAIQDGFEHALAMNGFRIREHGLMIIDPPSDSTLLSLGVKKIDLSQMKSKIQGSSHVLVLETIEKTEQVGIPELVGLKNPGPMIKTPGIAETVTIPTGANKEVKTTFLETPPVSLSAQPFLVEVEEKGRTVALLGYDMNPKQKRSTESVVYPNAPVEDYRAMARKLASNLQARQQLGVVGTVMPRIPLQTIKRI